MATSETLRSVIDAGRTSRRLDELSAARVIGKVALQVHAAQQKAGAGKSIGPVSPSAVGFAPTGEISVELPATGALGYSAPEQVSGSAGDRRSDVFSLGIVMWEALTHQRLFEAMNDAAVKAAVTEREIKAPAEINANIPAELSAICMRALARNPADRYQSAKSMAVEIEEFLEEAGYADNDEQIAAFLADLGKPRQEKKVTLPPANRIKSPTAPPPSAVPSVLTAPTQPPSVLKSSQPTGTAIANALANAGTAAPPDKATTSPGLGPSVLVTPAPTGNARTANGTAPPPLVPMPPILPSTTIAGTGAPSRAEVEAEVAKIETARAEAEKAADAAKAQAARIEAERIEAARIEAERIEAARIEAEKAEAAKDEAAVAEAARAAAARADAAKAEAARIEAEKADAAKAHAAKADAQNADAANADATKADAAKTDAAKADAAKSGSKKADASQTVLGIGAITHTPAPPVTADEAATPKPAAETVQLPATAASAGAASKPAAETVQLSAATADEAAPVTSMTGTDSRPSRPGTSPPHPASVVSLPQGKDKDVLAGWGWGTDSHQAITDDDDLDLPASTNNRKLLMYIGGGGVAFTALVAIIAFGFGGSKKKPGPPPAAHTQEWNQIGSATPDRINGSATGEATMAPGSAASAVAGSADLGSAVATGSADLGSAVAADSNATGSATAIAATTTTPAGSAASPMVATTEPTKPEPTKPEPTKPEITKPEPTKPPAETRPPVIAKTTTKAPPTRTTPAKTTTRTTAKTTKTTRSTTGTPVDPYAEAKPAKTTAKASKVDVETAYRAGLQQFARGDTTGALASLRTSLAGNPNYAPTWRALGLVFEKLGEKDQARAAYKRYLQLAPSAGDAGQIRSRLERLQ